MAKQKISRSDKERLKALNWLNDTVNSAIQGREWLRKRNKNKKSS